MNDGIEYMALAATGAAIPGRIPAVSGICTTINVVTVRPEGIKVAVLPVGAVIDPRQFTPERAADIDSVRRVNPSVTSPPMTLTADGLGAGVYEITLANPSRRPVEFTLTSEADAGEWIISPDHQHHVVAAGQQQSFAFTYVRVRSALTSSAQAPVFLLETDYLEESARTTLPPRRFPAQMQLGELPPAFFLPPASEVALHSGGESSGVRIESTNFELPDGPFTLEGWVRPEKLQPTAGLIAKTQGSEYGLLAEAGVVSFLVHLNDRYASATAPDPLPLHTWTHVAGVFDGRSVSLFINGSRVGRSDATGVRQRNALPLFLGADPDQQGNPTRGLAGWVDEVRLSTGARYQDNFTPARRHEPDATTVLLFHLDRLVGDRVPDHGSARAHGQLVGGAGLSAAP